MRLLLDTHLLVSMHMGDPPGAGTAAERLLTSAEHALFFSMASVWEVAIKHALPDTRKNIMPIAPRPFLELSQQGGAALLPIGPEHIFALAVLPALHGDPFDRLLVAQAVAEGMRLVTRDKLLARYSDAVVVI